MRGIDLPSGERFPRPFCANNESRWTKTFSMAPGLVGQVAHSEKNGRISLQAVDNRVLSANVSRPCGELSARELLTDVF